VRELRRWPGAFSLVMATGILSVGASDLGFTLLSRALLAIALAAMLPLVWWHGAALVHWDPGLAATADGAFGSLTFVAAVAVLGSRLAAPGDARFAIGLAGWVAALLAWLRMAPAAVGLASRLGPRVSREASGQWCLAAVAPFAPAVLAAELAKLRGSGPLFIAALGFGAVGLVAYAFVAVALGARLAGRHLALADLTPDWWITMGALAIATLAGDSIARAIPAAGVLEGGADAVRGIAHVTWWAATVLIVPLAVAFAARLLRERHPSDVSRAWAAIFPLGMYALASHRLAMDLGSSTQDAIGKAFFWIALAVWALAAVATAAASAESP
jgi:Voltage-dependent anion channel